MAVRNLRAVCAPQQEKRGRQNTKRASQDLHDKPHRLKMDYLENLMKARPAEISYQDYHIELRQALISYQDYHMLSFYKLSSQALQRALAPPYYAVIREYETALSRPYESEK